jgi:hypothetical protein
VAWEHYSETLARVREPVLFEVVNRGYAALEAVKYISSDEALSAYDYDALVTQNLGWLCTALRTIGDRAGIPAKQVDAEISRLNPTTTRPVGERVSLVRRDVPPSLLSQLVDIQQAAGQTPGSALETTPLPAPSTAPVAPLPGDSRSPLAAPPSTLDILFRVYDAKGSADLSTAKFPLVRVAGGPPSADTDAEATYSAMVQTYDFYKDVYARDPAPGGAMDAVVHYGEDYDNVFWDGERLVVGDGDGILFGPFSNCLEVLAHELSHPVFQDAGLRFSGQAGALLESACDVFGLLIKQWTLAQTADQADWLVGAGLLAPGIAGVGLRSLAAPGTAYDDSRLGKDPQPRHMNAYVHTDQDNGGVHINSGIPNHAFYLVASHLGGYAWERAGAVWYHTMSSGALTSAASFAAFAGVTVAVAARDFSVATEVADTVRDAWKIVGVAPRLSKRAANVVGIEQIQMDG